MSSKPPLLLLLLLAMATTLRAQEDEETTSCPEGFESVIINGTPFCDPACTEDETRNANTFVCQPVVCSVKYGQGYFFNLQTRLCENIAPGPDEVVPDESGGDGGLPSSGGDGGSNIVDAISPGDGCPTGQELISLNGFNFCTPECTEDEERLSSAQCQGVDCVVKYGTGHIFNITSRLCEQSATEGSFLDGLLPDGSDLGGLLDPVIIIDGNLTNNLFTNSSDNEIIQEKSDEELASLDSRQKFSFSSLTLKGWITLFLLVVVGGVMIRTIVRFVRRFWPGFCQCDLLGLCQRMREKAATGTASKTKTKTKTKEAHPNWDNCGEVIYDIRSPPPFVRVTGSEGESDDKNIP